jgi:PAT family beta-lactamase induction signal transducer AmpG
MTTRSEAAAGPGTDGAASPATPAPKPTVRQVLASPKMLVIMVLGAASGFPNQITESTLQAWLKDFQVSNTTIGIFSYVALPYLLKFLWAPLLDRYPLPLLDRRRGWMLVFQLAIAAAIAVLAFQDPSQSLALVAVCATAIVFFSASQDIVIDAWRTDVSRPEERGLAAAANNLGYRTAAWLAFAFSLVMADAFGWHVSLLVVAATMALFAVATWFAPSPEYRSPPPASLAESVVQPLKELLGSPGALGFVALIMLFKIGDAFALKLFTPFLMDMGFTKTEIGLIAKAVLTTAAIAGAVLGGIWMVKLGLLRSMLLFGVLQAVTNLMYWLLAVTGKSYPLMIAAAAIDNLAGAMGNIAVVALIMALCDVRFSAFQYALLSVIALLPRYALGGPAGWLADNGGWPTYYLVSFAIGLPGIAFVWALRDRVRALDVKP